MVRCGWYVYVLLWRTAMVPVGGGNMAIILTILIVCILWCMHEQSKYIEWDGEMKKRKRR
jgi:hypothetical protein